MTIIRITDIEHNQSDNHHHHHHHHHHQDWTVAAKN